MDFLEYSDVSTEIKGAMIPGKLKFTDQNIIFKNSKTGKVDQFASSDLDLVSWQKLVGTCALRVFLKNGHLHRFSGFKESEQEKIAKFFKTNYKMETLEKELSLKGWNWGTARFTGAVCSFDVGNHSAFEIPLNNVSTCTPGKNEVTVEFHQTDDAPVNLVEMRFHIPSAEAGEDPVEAFQKQVMEKASVINVSGDAIAIFREVQCITPRGRYDIKMFQSFFQLHGKTFDYKIPISTVLRLFLLPHKDGRQMYFVISLDPPIKQGQTRYHYLTLLFSNEGDESIELPFSEEEVKEKFEGKLEKEMSGPMYELLGRIMKVVSNRKLTGPGGFIGHSGTPAIGCSYKAAAGHIYPLERGFLYVHKPPIHIRYEEISSVNFARGGGSTRSFDFEIELKSSVVHTFSSIEKEEYEKLWDYISTKNLRVKNSGKTKAGYSADDFGDSDNEAEPDAYLARVKREGEERDEDGGDESDESTDEDFVPGELPDEDESAGSGTSDDSDEGSDASGNASPKKASKSKGKDKKIDKEKAKDTDEEEDEEEEKKSKKKDQKKDKKKKAKDTDEEEDEEEEKESKKKSKEVKEPKEKKAKIEKKEKPEKKASPKKGAKTESPSKGTYTSKETISDDDTSSDESK